MKRLWYKLRALFTDDFEGCDTRQLSRKDIRSLLYGSFLICALTILAVCITYNISSAKANEQATKEIQQLLESVTAYLAASTDDEYSEIARQLRDDLVQTKYSRNVESFAHYIPNTADECCAEQNSRTAQVYLVCINTGQMYSLEEDNAESDSENGGKEYSIMRFAYDEISETTVRMQLLPGQNRASVAFGQGRGVVSVHCMKELFCDSCINKILAAVKNSLMPEYVLLDPVNMTYYSVSEGKRIFGGYTFTTTYGSRGYEIEVLCENG